MEEVPPFFMDDDANLFNFQPDEDNFNISELLWSPSEEVPVNQSSMLQNPGPDSSLQSQNTQQMEGVPPSSMEDDVNLFDFQPNKDTFNMSELLSPLEEVLVNQSSILCNDQGGQNMLADNNDSTQQTTQFPPHNHQVYGDHDLLNSNCYDSTFFEPTSSSRQPQQGHVNMTPNTTTSLHGGFNQPRPSLPAPRIQCIPNQGQVDQASVIPNIDNMQQENLMLRNFGKSTRSQMENLQVHVLQNQTARPNASNPGPNSSLQSQNRGLNTQQVQRAGSRDPFWNYVEEKDDGSMICRFCRRRWANKIPISRFKWHLSGEERRGVAICPSVNKKVQEEALKAMCGSNKRHKSTASSINVNDHGISTCPQKQNIENENMGGDTRRVLRDVQVVEAGVGEERISSYAVVSMTGMRAQEDRVSEGGLESRLMVEPVDRVLEQSNLAGTARRTQVGVQGTEQGAGEERIQSHSQAENAMEDTGEGSLGHDAFQTIPRTEQVHDAQDMIMRGGNKRKKSIPSSSNVNDYAISTCPQEQDNAGDAGRMQVGVQGMENTGEGSFQHVDRSVSPWTVGVDAHESRGEATQGTNVVDQLADGTRHQIFSEAQKLNEINLMVEEEDEEPGAGARSSRILKHNTSETRGVPFHTSSNKPVGQAFEENTKVIWSLLMNDEVPTIGIYGMGGVGKTTILQHIHNELLERPDICDHVWWVTVSQDFSINRLQNLIAKRLDLDLSSEDDDPYRAAKLSEELRKKQKWILILDDLWNSFELHDVGIHSSLKGCKLILTTRSQTVCAQIDCQHKIEVKPLLEGESWTLFKENLGCHMALSDEVERIAKAITMECAGLPLAIITIARSLRGVDDLHEWRTTLKKLRELKCKDMDEKVFRVLRVSYDRLDDGLALKECLLYCALYPQDEIIEREELIGYLIDEGIIKGMRSRQDEFDEGHTMLNRLQYVCLLESDKTEDGGKYVKMHDLIRDMAIQILQENSQVIVKAGAQLVELPDAQEWTENLTRVSLMENKFEEISSSHSPMCPNLSTLMLCQNKRLRFIADSFFKQLHGLKILNLSRTSIEKLPESVSDLVSLIALLLHNCLLLRYVPSLEKLRALKSLDLYYTSLDKMPQGMECLSNLRYFRIDECGVKEFPSGILPKLSHLQVLAIGQFPTECFTVEGMEVGCLGKLETLQCYFKGFSDFVEYLTSRDGIQSLSTYKILVGTLNEDSWFDSNDFPSKTVLLGNLSINRGRDFQVKFLNGIQGLYCESIDARSLCDVLSLENATELEIIHIQDCDSMESLVSSSWFCSATLPLPSHNGMFSRLKEFCCIGCHSMEKLFPLELLSCLVNLEVIRVIHCMKMEEIIGTTDEESSTSNPIAELTLPKLTNLYLLVLPELKGICRAKLICNSLKVIEVANCEKLKRMAISLPLLENGQPSPHPSLKRITAYPEEWWETVVEWEPPNAKEVLRPIVHF